MASRTRLGVPGAELKDAIARAIARSGRPKVGALQPSMPISIDAGVTSANRATLLTFAFWSGWVGWRYVSSGARMNLVAETIPECLPEQLLWMAVGSFPDLRRSRRPRVPLGGWAPHWRWPTVSFAFFRIDEAARTCSGSPGWEPQMTAISSAEKPYASAAPLSTTLSPWKGLAHDRMKTGWSTAPRTIAGFPASRATREMRWTDSTSPLRWYSQRISFIEALS